MPSIGWPDSSVTVPVTCAALAREASMPPVVAGAVTVMGVPSSCGPLSSYYSER